MLILTLEREARGWSRSELARRSRMNPADVSRIESGRFVPYPTQLRKLARALHWPADTAGELLNNKPTSAGGKQAAAHPAGDASATARKP